jgi:hypothetical protein
MLNRNRILIHAPPQETRFLSTVTGGRVRMSRALLLSLMEELDKDLTGEQGVTKFAFPRTPSWDRSSARASTQIINSTGFTITPALVMEN